MEDIRKPVKAVNNKKKKTQKKLPPFTFENVLRGVVRAFISTQKRIAPIALAFILILIQARGFVAFEAFVLNATADIFMIDPPVITPPGGDYNAPLNIDIDDADPDATHIFYTITPGLSSDSAPDPMCGGPLGGPKPLGPIAITEDSVVKAIACDANNVSAHNSTVSVEIYDLTLLGMIEGYKYHDLDQSGTFTNGDTPINGWQITLEGATSTVSTTMTGADGHYSFMDLETGIYDVVEETRDGWDNITPTSSQVSLPSGQSITRNFFNFDTGFSCVPKTVIFPLNLALMAAGATASSSNDDVGIANNVTVNGDVRSNDEIERIGGNGPRTINGNAAAVNTIDPDITITGTSSTGVSAVALPDIMISEWKTRAQDGGTVNGSFIFPNGTTGLNMGPTEIMGNLTFGSSNGVQVDGPIYVHGNLTIGSNTTITQDPAFGDQFVTIIVDGTVSIDSNVAFVGSTSSTGAFLLVSTHAAVAGDGAAILTSSNNSDLGRVVLYASDGDIHINQNRTILAAFATHGTGTDADDNGAIRIDPNVTVNYQTLPTQISCGARQPYESTSHVLINEFMPNPLGIGTDSGSAGLPHDGEWVEIFNPTASSVDVTGYVLYDSNNTHALPITATNTVGTLNIPSHGFLVVYRDGDTDFELNNSGGDSVRLFTGLIGSGGILVDSHIYTVSAPDDKSFSRIPDGASNWIDPDATPGEPNDDSFISQASQPVFTPPDNPPLVVESPEGEIDFNADDLNSTSTDPNIDIDNALSTVSVAEDPTDTSTSTTETVVGGGFGGGGGGTSETTQNSTATSSEDIVNETSTIDTQDNSNTSSSDATSTDSGASDTQNSSSTDDTTSSSTDSGTTDNTQSASSTTDATGDTTTTDTTGSDTQTADTPETQTDSVITPPDTSTPPPDTTTQPPADPPPTDTSTTQ